MMGIEPVTRKEMFMAAAAGESVVAPTPVTREEYFLSKIAGSGGGGGGGVQPDWNQNDDTQPDYVKNRPFYTGDPVETVLVEETTAQFVEENGLYFAEVPSTFEATVGETYKVSWDGAAYECICWELENTPFLGNPSMEGVSSDTGEPFLMAVSNGRGVSISTADTSDSHTFSISAFVTEIVKIDEKYLPGTVANKSEVAAAQATADAAQTAAENAQATADAAQTAAENAQATADAAQTAADNAVGADVVKDSFTLRIGEKKYAGYGFAILYDDSVRMNYTDTGMYDEYSGSSLNMRGQSVFKASSTSKKKIVITTNNDSGSNENSIELYTKDGGYIEICADGVLYSSAAALRFGHQQKRTILRYVNTPEEEYDAATKGYVDGKISDTEIFLQSSTPGSNKKFRVTVDDSGTLTATEVTA